MSSPGLQACLLYTSVHHDVNMVRVVEGSCCAVVCGIVEIPLRRSLVPDELIELVEVFRIAGLADFSGEIVLVPVSYTHLLQ